MTPFRSKIICASLVFSCLKCGAKGFVPSSGQLRHYHKGPNTLTAVPSMSTKLYSSAYNGSEPNQSAAEWDGNVVSNSIDGKIRGCSIQPVDGSEVDWILRIDGVEADLGRFSEAIYKKIISDAKQQRFQGFKPGTIPAHLEPTYRAFAMDECARETVLEALQQNNIRPFESCRQDMLLESFSIPAAPIKQKKKSSKRKKQSSSSGGVAATDASTESSTAAPATEEWRVFDTMKQAIDAGWRPGQSFSFVAKGVKGQVVADDAVTGPSVPLGIGQR